jgi:hypothetical protein
MAEPEFNDLKTAMLSRAPGHAKARAMPNVTKTRKYKKRNRLAGDNVQFGRAMMLKSADGYALLPSILRVLPCFFCLPSCLGLSP